MVSIHVPTIPVLALCIGEFQVLVPLRYLIIQFSVVISELLSPPAPPLKGPTMAPIGLLALVSLFHWRDRMVSQLENLQENHEKWLN